MSDAHYELQGYYAAYRGKGRSWETHTRGLTLHEAQRGYKWFKYATMHYPVRTMPSNARIINTLTGEVVTDLPEMHVPEKLPGHRIKTIPITEREWRFLTWNYAMSSKHYKSVDRPDGLTVYSFGGRNGTFAYRMPDGSYRLDPVHYMNVPED